MGSVGFRQDLFICHKRVYCVEQGGGEAVISENLIIVSARCLSDHGDVDFSCFVGRGVGYIEYSLDVAA